jgi:hypothetical protein
MTSLPGTISLGLAVVAAAIELGRASATPTVRASAAGEKQLEACWIDLEGGDAQGSRALLKLYTQGKETVPFLKGKLKPLQVTSAQVKALLLKLNSTDEHLWKPPFEELEYFDPRLAIGLRELMERVTDAPARQRLAEVLSDRESGSLEGLEIEFRTAKVGYTLFARGHGSWWAESSVGQLNTARWGNSKRKWTRAQRSIVLLGHIGTPEAIAILNEMATGHREAMPTRVAKEALQRVGAEKARLEDCWRDLEKGDVEASRALLALSDRGQEAVNFLKGTMKPLTITSGRVKALLLKLNSANKDVWKPAFEELEYLDPRLAIGLEDLMERVTESRARQRLVAVLSDFEPGSLSGKEITIIRGDGSFDFLSGRRVWTAEHKVSEINGKPTGLFKRKWTRAERAIVLLEHFRSAECISILKEMAKGHPEARPTVVAKEALARIDRPEL